MSTAESGLKNILKAGINYLRKHGVPEARPNAEFLLAHVFGIRRTEIPLWEEKKASPGRFKKYESLLRLKGKKRMPLAYILGNQEFMGLNFKLKPRVTLIPRPETELLVETVLKKIHFQYPQNERLIIADIGTGSGCIAISLWHFLRSAYKINVVATDVSSKALLVAEKNAEFLKAEIRFIRTRLLQGIPKNLRFHVIASNPPYVDKERWATLEPEMTKWEPHGAFLAGDHGMAVLKKVIKEAAKRLFPGGWLALEMNPAQAAPLTKELRRFGYSEIQIIKDLNGHRRILMAQWPLKLP